MLSRVEAIVETGLMPPQFRDICDKLDIDSDQESFTTVEINNIKTKAGIKCKIVSSTVDGYSASECAELLGVSPSNFNGNYAHKAIKVRRGIYNKESIHKLIQQIEKKKGHATYEQQEEERPIVYKEKERLQRLSVSEDENGNAVVSIFIENITAKQALQLMLDTLTA